MLVALAAGLTLVPTVMVDAREVRVGDLVRGGDRGRLSARAAARVVMRLPAGRRQVTLAGPAAAALVRRAGVAMESGDPTAIAPVTITVRDSLPTTRRCWTSARALAAGDVVTARDVAPADCGGEPAAVGEAAGAPVVRDAVPAGAALGRLAPVAAGRIAPGTALTLRSVAGPVTIERGVTTMQPGRSGHGVFVRDGEGRVFAAPLALVEDAR